MNTYGNMSRLCCSDCGKQIGWQGSHPVGYLVCDECHDEGERKEISDQTDAGSEK